MLLNILTYLDEVGEAVIELAVISYQVLANHQIAAGFDLPDFTKEIQKFRRRK